MQKSKDLNRRGRKETPWASIHVRVTLLHMGHTLTIRLTEELAVWLKETSRSTGIPMGKLVREELENAKAKHGKQRFLRHLGAISGPPDLSTRKGFSKR
jgi:hypothetical protein